MISYQSPKLLNLLTHQSKSWTSEINNSYQISSNPLNLQFYKNQLAVPESQVLSLVQEFSACRADFCSPFFVNKNTPFDAQTFFND